MGFDRKLMNKVVSPKNQAANTRRNPTKASRVMVRTLKGKAIGRTSGVFQDMSDGHRWYKVTFLKKKGNPLRIYGWIRSDVAKLTEPVSNPEVNSLALIRTIINNDKKLIKRLVVIGNQLIELKKEGADVTKYVKRFEILVKRYNRRQSLLKNSKTLEFTQEAAISLTKLFLIFTRPGGISIGVVPAVVLPIGELIAVLVAATAAYFIFRPELDDSLVDLDVSTELQDVLDQLDPELKDEILEDLEEQIDNAAEKGASAINTDEIINKIRNIAIGVGVFILAKEVLQLEQSKVKRK